MSSSERRGRVTHPCPAPTRRKSLAHVGGERTEMVDVLRVMRELQLLGEGRFL